MTKERWIGLGMALVVLSWGLNYVITKIGVTHLNPVDFVFWRFLGTAAITIPWMIKHHPRTGREWIHLVVLGLLGVSLYQWLFATALHLTLSANVAFLFNLSPLLTLLWQRFATRLAVNRLMWLGVMISFGGVALLAGASLNGGYLGDGFAVLAAASWSAFVVMTERFQVSVKGLSQTGWISAAGALGILPFMQYEPIWRFGAFTWLPLLYTIVFVTIMGLSLWQNAVATLGASRASLVLYLIPLVAAASGWIFLGERLTPGEGVGALCILFGVALADGRIRWGAPTPSSS